MFHSIHMIWGVYVYLGCYRQNVLWLDLFAAPSFALPLCYRVTECGM